MDHTAEFTHGEQGGGEMEVGDDLGSRLTTAS